MGNNENHHLGPLRLFVFPFPFGFYLSTLRYLFYTIEDSSRAIAPALRFSDCSGKKRILAISLTQYLVTEIFTYDLFSEKLRLLQCLSQFPPIQPRGRKEIYGFSSVVPRMCSIFKSSIT